MDDLSVSAPVADPEPIVATPETEGQVATDPAAEVPAEDTPEQKTAAASRREREKANKARLVAERDAALKEAADLRAKQEKLLSIGKTDKSPVESDFTDYAEFLTAKARWATKQEFVEHDARIVAEAADAARNRAEESGRQEQAMIAQAWASQVTEAKSKYADFEAVALSPDVPVSDAMADLIRTSDSGADVAYFLGQNKATAAQIAQLPPMEAARAIGRIEASISQPKPRTETQAPDPIRPVRGSASPVMNPEKMSYSDYVAARKSGKLK